MKLAKVDWENGCEECWTAARAAGVVDVEGDSSYVRAPEEWIGRPCPHGASESAVAILVGVEWCLYDRIGGVRYLPGEVARWGWSRGGNVEDGGQPDEVDEQGGCSAAELAGLVEPYADDPGGTSDIRSVRRYGRSLVVYDESNDAWWLAGLVPAAPVAARGEE